MIAVSVIPDVVACGQATEAVVAVVNRSPTAVVRELVVEIEPDHHLQLDGGDVHIERDTLRPGETYPHPVILTGRLAGTGLIALPYITYRTDTGGAHRLAADPLAVTVRTAPKPAPSPTMTSPVTPLARLPSTLISHRHADSGWLGEYLRDGLKKRLTGSRIFLDHEDIGPGDLWRTLIDDELDHARALCAVIGPQWMTCADSSGRRRIEQPDDVVRHEIATALRRQIAVIPVLHDGARMPHADELPLDLRALVERQAVTVEHGTGRATLRTIAAKLRGAGLR